MYACIKHSYIRTRTRIHTNARTHMHTRVTYCSACSTSYLCNQNLNMHGIDDIASWLIYKSSYRDQCTSASLKIVNDDIMMFDHFFSDQDKQRLYDSTLQHHQFRSHFDNLGKRGEKERERERAQATSISQRRNAASRLPRTGRSSSPPPLPPPDSSPPP